MRGFLPLRGLRRLTEKVPKPTSVTGWPRLSELRIDASSARSARSAAALVHPDASAMEVTSSALVIVGALLRGGSRMLAEPVGERQPPVVCLEGMERVRAARIFLAGMLLFVAGPSWAWAEEPEPSPVEPSAASDLTLTPGAPDRGIPWDRLDAGAYAAVRAVVSGSPIVREVRHIAFRSRRPVLDFLLDHPDFAAHVGRIVREGKYQLRRVGDVFEVDDGASARGMMKPLFADGGRRVFYVEGRYDPPLLPALAGRLVILLDAEHLEGSDGITYCEMSVAGYVRFDSGFAEALGAASRSLSESRVDRKVRRFFRHVAALSRRAYDDPQGLADELARRPDLPPERVAEFKDLLLAHLPPAWSETQRFQLLETREIELDRE